MNISSSLAASVWPSLQNEAQFFTAGFEPLDRFVRSLGGGAGLHEALPRLLASHLAAAQADEASLAALFAELHAKDEGLSLAASYDLAAVKARDPAAGGLLRPFLFFKGYHAIQAHRLAHALWQSGRQDTALFLQSRASLVFGVDAHPAARLGRGLMMDHATGVVIGETAVIEDDVSILHGVTLGGTGNETGDRHPKIGRGVMIGAGTKILGNIRVGEGACIAAGSVVLKDVPAHVTVAGVPAQIVGRPRAAVPAEAMDQLVVD